MKCFVLWYILILVGFVLFCFYLVLIFDDVGVVVVAGLFNLF